MINLKKEEDKSKNNFPLLYTCLSIIILTFFVFLTTNSTISPERQKVAIGSLIGSFGLLNSSINPVNYKNKNFGIKIVTIGNSKDVISTILKIIRQSKFEKYINLKNIKGELLIQTKGNIAFKLGTDILTQSYYVFLNRIYTIFSKVSSLKIRIIAYPDNTISPQFISKWDLATHRAYRIVKFFQKRGINLNKIMAFGKGVVQMDGKKLEIIFTGKKYEKNKKISKINIKGFEF